MEMMRFMVILAAIAGLLFSVMGLPIAQAATTVPGTVEILPKTCGITVAEATLNYGSLLEGEVSALQPLDLVTTGNTNQDASISGSNWIFNDPDAGPIVVMSVTRTHWGLAGAFTSASDYESANSLSTSPTPLLINAPSGGNVALKFAVKVVLDSPSFTGTATQEVYLASEC